MPFCRVCGKEISSEAKFCPHCGSNCSDLFESLDTTFASKIVDEKMALKPIDRDFALKLVDKMIEWDRQVIRPGYRASEEDLHVLDNIYDYFFFALLKAKPEGIENLQLLFGELLSRVHNKHRNPYYEGFFNALVQVLLFRRLLLITGEDLWLVEWINSFQKSLSKLGLR